MARRERDDQWAFMERIAREGVVWMCPWDKYHRHGQRCVSQWCQSRSFTEAEGQWKCAQCGRIMPAIPDDKVYVFGLIGANELFHWIDSHPTWWKRGRWSNKRCASSIRLTEHGLRALRNRHHYDAEDIHGGMVEPGYVVRPLPRRATCAEARP